MLRDNWLEKRMFIHLSYISRGDRGKSHCRGSHGFFIYIYQGSKDQRPIIQNLRLQLSKLYKIKLDKQII